MDKEDEKVENRAKVLRPKEIVEYTLNADDLEEAYKRTVNFKTSIEKVYITEYFFVFTEFSRSSDENQFNYLNNKQKIHIQTLNVMYDKIPLIHTHDGMRKMYSLGGDSVVLKLNNAKHKAEMLFTPYFSPVHKLCSNKDKINNEIFDKAIDYLFSDLYEVENTENAKIYFKHFMINTKRSVLGLECQYEQILSLFGLQGNGKSRFADTLCEALQGKEYKESIERMLGRFNTVLAHTGVIHIEEFGYVEKTMTDSLKSLITSSTVSIERKQKDIVTIPKRFQIIMSSNRNPRDLFYGEIYQRRSAVIKYLGYRHLFDFTVLKTFLRNLWECCPIEYEGYKPSITADISEKESSTSSDIFEGFAYEFYKGDGSSFANLLVEDFISIYESNAFHAKTFRLKQLQVIFENSLTNKINRYSLENFLLTQPKYVTVYNSNGSKSFRFTKAFYDKMLEYKSEYLPEDENKNSPSYVWTRPTDDFTEQLKAKIDELFEK